MSRGKRPPRGIIFDLNGTIHDMSVLRRQNIHVARVEYGETITDEDVHAAWGQPAETLFPQLFRRPRAPWQELAAAFRRYDDMFPRQALPGVRRMLAIAREARIVHGISTTTPEHLLFKCLGQAGIPHQTLDFVHGKETNAPQIEAGRPLLTEALNVCTNRGLNHDEIVVIGDEVANMHEANQIGVSFVAVANGTRTREELIRAGVPSGFIISTMLELPDFLQIPHRPRGGMSF